MQDTKKTKEVLEKILEEKEENLIRLLFDLHYVKKREEEINRKKREVSDKILRFEGEITVEKAKPRKLRDVEKMVKCQGEIKNLLLRKSNLAQQGNPERVKEHIKLQIGVNDILRECIKNPDIILKQDVEPRTDKKTNK